MLNLNRQKFWKSYRAKFVQDRVLLQAEVDGLNYFLDRLESETRISKIPEFAYILATAYHESGRRQKINDKFVMVRFQPVKEVRASPTKQPALYKLQNRYWHTGYYGRGFPQTTWEKNYRKSGEVLGLGDLFVKNPDLLLNPQYAYDAMVICMVKGLYTGKKLSTYINSSTKDYKNARRVVNGLDKAALIADYAEDFENILKTSVSPTSPAETPSVISANLPSEKAETLNESAPIIGEVKETVIEKIDEQGNREVETKKEEIKNTFEPSTITQYIPQITKSKWILGGFSLSGIVATVSAKLAEMPDWFVLLLGALAGIVLAGLIVLLITYHKQIFALVKTVVEKNADPTQNNIELVTEKTK